MEKIKNEILKLKLLKRNIIDGLSDEEVLYVHLHLSMSSEEEYGISGLDFPLDLEDYKIAKARIQFDKLEFDELREDLKKAANVTGLDGWFPMNAFYDIKSVMESSEIYLVLLHLLNTEIEELYMECTLDDFDNLKDILFSNIKVSEYNLLKLICVYKQSENIINVLEENSNGEYSQSEREHLIAELKNFTLNNIYRLSSKIANESIEWLHDIIDVRQSEVENLTNIVSEKEQKILEIENALKDTKKHVKENKSVDNSVNSAITLLSNKLKTLENTNNLLVKEVRSNRVDVVKAIYEEQVDKYIAENNKLHLDVQTKEREISALNEKISTMVGVNTTSIIDYIESHGLSVELLKYLQGVLPIGEVRAEDVIDEDILNVEVMDTSLDLNVVEEQRRRIGYVTIENGTHYINFGDGESVELKNLSDRVYLVDGQFIVVDENNNFNKTTLSKYEDNGISIKTLKLGIIESIHPLKVKVGDDIVDARNLNGFNPVYRINQVVGLNDSNQIARAFRTMKFSADTVMESIKARGLKTYYVLDVFSGGFLKLRDIETGLEDIHQLETDGIELVKYAVLFVRETKIVNAITQGRFYTSSSYYTSKITHGPIEVIDGVARIMKQTGEVAIVNNIPEGYIIEDGMVIAVDEFNNYLYISPTDKNFVDKAVLKKTARQVVSGSNSKKSIDMKGEVTIVGNPYYKNSYIMSFLKEGYKANVMHGYDSSPSEILQAAKDSVALIVSTSYCAHGNFWGVKDEVKSGALKGVKCFYTKENGANMLLRMFMEGMEKDNEVAITN